MAFCDSKHTATALWKETGKGRPRRFKWVGQVKIVNVTKSM